MLANVKSTFSKLVLANCKYKLLKIFYSTNSSNFGYKYVKTEEKQSKVNEVFDTVASKYDLMNDLMSFGFHRIWKDMFIKELNPKNDLKLIDVAGGTGDIAFRYLNFLKNLGQLQYKNNTNNVTVCDINANMLKVGESRAKLLGFSEYIKFAISNAENLQNENELTYDFYTISFGIRNCTHINKVLDEAYRVLKPGGKFMCLEFSEVTNKSFKKIYDFYSFQVIPPLGHLIANDWNSYQYLVESIRVFPKQDEFANLIEKSGFKNVSYSNLNNGIVAIHKAYKF